jgi:hypothetical protein
MATKRREGERLEGLANEENTIVLSVWMHFSKEFLMHLCRVSGVPSVDRERRYHVMSKAAENL